MTDAALDTTYEPFATEPEYIAVNRDFIDDLLIGRPERVLDLACGIGTLSSLLLERLQRDERRRFLGRDRRVLQRQAPETPGADRPFRAAPARSAPRSGRPAR